MLAAWGICQEYCWDIASYYIYIAFILHVILGIHNREFLEKILYGTGEEEIEFEYEYGSNEFIPVDKVRVDSVINYTSSMVVDADDFKTFIFLPDFPDVHLGMKFKWNNSYWLVISNNCKNF